MKSSVVALVVAVLVAAPGLAGRLEGAGLDRNGNGLNDVWELIFPGSALPADGDTDGDGFTNAEESAAGTDPRNAASHPRIRFIAGGTNSVAFNWDAVAGKRYRMLSRANVASGAWETNAVLIGYDVNGAAQFAPTGSLARFFRLAVDDVDSDGDGMTDFEERSLGFDPASLHSDRQDTADYQRFTNALSASSVVTVSAIDPLMFERWADPGLVAVRRSGGVAALTVNLAFSGTAARGVDYAASVPGNAIVIPAGVREVWIELHPVADADDLEGAETITVTALAGSGYSLGAATVANLTLGNETAASLPNQKAAARFLIQAAFGPDSAPTNGVAPQVQAVMAQGFAGWIDDQFTRPHGYIQPFVDWCSVNGPAAGLFGNWKEYSWWNRAMGVAMLHPDMPTNTIPDPLRQRVAFALSQILVVSDRPEQLAVEQGGMANFYDLMVKHAFGNYRDLLMEVSLHPAMGIYLSHLGNQKADPVNRIYPDENYAREIMQLFTIGLWELNQDGTRKLDTNGNFIATYDNSHITELARVFTGFTFGTNLMFTLYPRDFTVPMKCFDAFHDCNAKTLLGGLQLPARTASPTNAGVAGLADLDAAVSNLFVHPNVGPFVGRQLIQRLVTSNPGTGYVARVAAAFANNGSGVRGDLKAVVKAILLDPEARDPQMMHAPTFGKLREPFLRVVNFARAFNARSVSDWYVLDQFTLDHMQDPMNAPSVFNFFMPAHSPPGPLTQMGLVAPEFQIVNASSAITGPNYFWNAIENDLHRWGSGDPDNAVRINVTNELAMIVPAAQINQDVPAGPAADPDPLLRRLDLALTGGTLSPRQFQLIREAMLRLPTGYWKWHRDRLRVAIYLIVTSADFNVAR
jgi:uncharacterized protein (DUF1800 family)